MTTKTENRTTLLVEKRNGEIVDYDQLKIEKAIINAAIAAGKSQHYIETTINGLAFKITDEVHERFSNNDFNLNVENIHDIVEKQLMIANLFEVAKAYILYRNDRKKESDAIRKSLTFLRKLKVTKADGRTVRFNPKKIKDVIARYGKDLNINVESVFDEAIKTIYDGVTSSEIDKSLVYAAVSLLEIDPDYGKLAARIFRQQLRKETFGHSTEDGSEEANRCYRESFVSSIEMGVEEGIFDQRLLEFDLKYLSEKLQIERDESIKYIGLQTLYERYFVKNNGRLMELPQSFWMRVAMGLSMNEKNKEEWAVKFYEVMSDLYYVPSTPTLFHSGLMHPQLSSCYLTTIDDDLKDIFKSFQDNSQLSKWSGGIGNDWTNVRSIGAAIQSTRVESQGTIPFLKIANDTTVAINRSGKRRGATVAYLETWHLDIEDFLDLRRNTGDDRRRTHDMNTSNWIPDLFMKRVIKNGKWTLFSPDEVPDLHDLYGKDFDKKYASYERKAAQGKIKKFKVIEAVALWRKMIERLFETGHPWICFKDACNIRSPQDHVGVVHSSNLCTEITLNTSASKLVKEVVEDGILKREFKLGEVAVCNLGSLVLARLMDGKKINKSKIADVIAIAMRMLDNVVDLNFYPIQEARNSNLKHRPVGLGIMGLQDAIIQADLDFESAYDFVDELQEFISYHAILNSCKLAEERGKYESFNGSKWDRGIFPLDTLDILAEERGLDVDVNRTSREDWKKLKELVAVHGMRNSNTMAIAPTATIANITGCVPSIEPFFKNMFVKSNMSGEFTVVNEYLVNDLKAVGLWDKEMLDDIKFHDGSIQKVDRIPNAIKNKHKESFEFDPKVLIDLTALRGKWIDQSQSHNIFIQGKSGKQLSDIYMYAWSKGLKTTYYLRSMGVSQVEKSTLDAGKYGFTQKRESDKNYSNDHVGEIKLCKINDPDCEACQ